jgi:hypothetical protein
MEVEVTDQPPRTHNVSLDFKTRLKVSVLKEVTTRFIKVNWWLLLIYVLACLLGAFVSSYLGLTARSSFGASLAFSLFETWIGYYAISQWVKILREAGLQ